MVSFGRVSPDVTKAFIQREEAPPRAARRAGYNRIRVAGQSFVGNCIDGVPETHEILSQFGG